MLKYQPHTFFILFYFWASLVIRVLSCNSQKSEISVRGIVKEIRSLESPKETAEYSISKNDPVQNYQETFVLQKFTQT